MVELGARILFAGLLVFLSGLFALLPFGLAVASGVAIVALAVLQYRLELAKKTNAGIYGFLATADSTIIALWLAGAQVLTAFSFLVLVPVVVAYRRHGSPPAYMAPLAAFAVFIGQSIFAGPIIPPPILLFEIAAILGIGLLLPTRDSQSQTKESIDLVMHLREAHRKLQDNFDALERRSRTDRTIAAMEHFRALPREGFFEHFAAKIIQITRVAGVEIYRADTDRDLLVLAAEAGSPNASPEPISIDFHQSLGALKHRATLAITARTPDVETKRLPIALTEKGHVIALVYLLDEDGEALGRAEALLDPINGHLGKLVADCIFQDQAEKRIRHMQTLYETAVVSVGSETVESLAARLVSDMADIEGLDGCSINLIDEDSARTIASTPEAPDLLPELEFDGTTGQKAWIESGAEKLHIFNTADDARCPRATAIKLRVGSFGLIPLKSVSTVKGYIAVSSRRGGAISDETIDRLTVIGSEFIRSCERLEEGDIENAGLMPASEFQRAIAQRDGYLVTLEPVNPEGLQNTYGRASVNRAIRAMALRTVNLAPANAAVCKRSESSILAYLPSTDADAVGEWSRSVAEQLSAMELQTIDQKKKMLFPIRPRLAKLTKQKDEFSPFARANG